MLHRADTADVMFGYDDDFSADPMDNLTGVIGNLVSAEEKTESHTLNSEPVLGQLPQCA